MSSSGLQKLFLIGVFSPLLFLRWFLHALPGSRRGRRPSKSYQPPPLWLLRLITMPLRLMNPPQAVGLDKIPADKSTKIMLIGNQNLLGLDQLVLITLIYLRHGIFCRRLYDDLFKRVPFAGILLEALGGVVGTRKNAEELMSQGVPLLFYPGGVVESLSGPPLSLLWGERLGWCHLAIKHGYTVVPFASVGLDEALWVLVRLPLQPLLQLLDDQRTAIDLPILAPYNSLERNYILFGSPHSTEKYKGEYENLAFSQQVYSTVFERVSGLMDEGKEMAAKDPERYLSGRVWVAAVKTLSWTAGLFGLGGGDTRSGGSSDGSVVEPVGAAEIKEE